MVRPAQRPGVDREDRKQRGRGRCIALGLSVCSTEGTPARFHYSAISCLSPLAGDADPYSWECVCLSSKVGLPGDSEWHFQSIFKRILKDVSLPPLCLHLKRIEVGNFRFPLFPNPTFTPTSPDLLFAVPLLAYEIHQKQTRLFAE